MTYTKSLRSKPKNKTFKMNCHPNNKNKIHKNTCYSEDALLKIRDAYNTTHTNKIKTKNPKKIYNVLRKRLDHCEKEDCWMDIIKEPEVKYELDRLLFAPESPADWKKNPTTWLSNYDIRDVLKQYEVAYPKFKLLGPSSIDYDTILHDGKCVWQDLCRLSLKDLQRRHKSKLGVVFNLDEHYEPGSHWVSLFVDNDEKLILYYDSAVNPIPNEVKRLIREIQEQGKSLDNPIEYEVIKNKYSHQTTNTECGMYSLFFMITMMSGKLNKSIRNQMNGGGKGMSYRLSRDQKIMLFTEPGLNDTMMKKFRKEYFN